MDCYEELIIETQNETVGDNETLSVYKKLQLDHSMFLFMVGLLHNREIFRAPHPQTTIIIGDYITPVPLLFFYFLGLSTNESTGVRMLEIGILDWRNGLYGRLRVKYQIYPLKSKYITHALRKWINPYHCVLGQARLNEEIHESFITDTLRRALVTIRINSYWPVERVIDCCMDIHGYYFSQRLMQIFWYHEHMLRYVRIYLVNNCKCVLDHYGDSKHCKCDSLCEGVRLVYPDAAMLFKTC